MKTSFYRHHILGKKYAMSGAQIDLSTILNDFASF